MTVDFETLLYTPKYEVFGRSATYAAPDSADVVSCTVIRNKQDVELSVGNFGRPQMQGDVIKVRASEIAAPEKRGRFIVGAETLEIIDDPQCLESERLEWTMTVRTVS